MTLSGLLKKLKGAGIMPKSANGGYTYELNSKILSFREQDGQVPLLYLSVGTTAVRVACQTVKEAIQFFSDCPQPEPLAPTPTAPQEPTVDFSTFPSPDSVRSMLLG